MHLLTVIIPFKNEEENILPLAGSIYSALQDIDHELIWVDDGSTDASSKMVSLSGRGRLIVLEENYGQSIAIKAGIDHSHGRYVAFLDADGQNDPQDIKVLLQIIEKGNWDMVAGIRINRHDNLKKKVPSAIANWIIRKLTGIKNRDLGCTLKILKREMALQLPLNKGMHRFIPVLVKRLGGKSTQLPVMHHPRTAGQSKYGLERIFTVSKDLLTLVLKRKLPQENRLYLVRSIHELKNSVQPGKVPPVSPVQLAG